MGSDKFTKVKNAPEFVKELENFHFGEKDFIEMTLKEVLLPIRQHSK